MAKSPRNVQKGNLPKSDVPKADVQKGDMIIADGEPLYLHNKPLAAFLSWLIPGAGHYYQGRKLKASIYFVSIATCVLIGMLVSGGRCVYASWNGVEKRWQFALQAGVGLPAIPAAVQAWRKSSDKPPLFQGWFFGADQPAPFAAPSNVRQLNEWHRQTASGFELGTLYTMIAGLLNVLAIYDAYAGPLPPPVSGKKSEDETAGSKKDSP
jgi:hypothetical protein